MRAKGLSALGGHYSGTALDSESDKLVTAVMCVEPMGKAIVQGVYVIQRFSFGIIWEDSSKKVKVANSALAGDETAGLRKRELWWN